MAHVGDVHAHFPAVFAERTNRKCIVEVLRVAGVDGKGGHVAEIFAARNFLGRDARFDSLGGVLNGLGIVIGEAIFGQDGVHLGVVFALGAQNVHHFAHGALAVFGPIGDFHHRFVSGFSAVQGIGRYKDVCGQSALVDEERIVALHVEAAHEGFAGAANDFSHFCLTCVPTSASQHRHPHMVAVEGVVCVAFGDENVLAAVVGNEHVVAVSLAAKHPFDDLHVAFGMAIVACAVGGEEIVGNEVGQRVEYEHLGRVVHRSHSAEERFYVIGGAGAVLEHDEQAIAHFFFVQAGACSLFGHDVGEVKVLFFLLPPRCGA